MHCRVRFKTTLPLWFWGHTSVQATVCLGLLCLSLLPFLGKIFFFFFFTVNEATNPYINRGKVGDGEIKDKASWVWHRGGGNSGARVLQHQEGTRKFGEPKGLLGNVVG